MHESTLCAIKIYKFISSNLLEVKKSRKFYQKILLNLMD